MAKITDAALNNILDFLETQISHVGIGTGSAPTGTDTSLASETERKLATKFLDDNTLVVEGFWDVSEANSVTYSNAGTFGNGATGTVGTGELFAGGEIDVEKINTETLTVTFEITVEEGV